MRLVTEHSRWRSPAPGSLAGGAAAEVTVVGWPGGPEETALRAAAEIYNAKPDVAEENKVELIFFSRDGFLDKLQADLAAGSDAFDANLLATYSIGRYAPFMEPIELSRPRREAVFGAPVLQTMQFDGQAVRRADRPVAALPLLPQGPDRRTARRPGGAGEVQRDRAGSISARR